MFPHCKYCPFYDYCSSQLQPTCCMPENNLILNTIHNNVNWNDYINSWVLIKTFDDKWYFGKLTEYDANNRKMKLLALINRKFYYIEKDADSIIKAWSVDQWTQYRLGSRAAKTLAYVANYNDNNIAIIDTQTRELVGEPISNIRRPYGLAITPDGQRIYVTSDLDNTVTAIDANTHKPIGGPIPVGDSPKEIAITPDGQYAFITNFGDHTVSVIDITNNNSLIDTINVGRYPVDITITPDGKLAYVAHGWDHILSIIDTKTRKVIGEPIPVSSPNSIAITPDGKYALVSGSDKVTYINLDNNQIDKEITVGPYATWVAITPNGKLAYVLNANFDTVSVIDVVNKTTVGEKISVGDQPQRVAITPDDNYAFITNHKDDTVSVIDTSTNKVVGNSIPVGDGPMGIAIAKIENGTEPDEEFWNNWINYWILFQYSNGEWVFGKLRGYDSNTQQINLLSLVDNHFRNTNESTKNIIEIWRADQWTNLMNRTIEEPLLAYRGQWEI